MHRILKSLFPEGYIWNFSKEDLFLEGVGEGFHDIKDYLANLADIRDPYKTDDLDSLERDYGIIKNSSLSEANRRNHLASVKFSRRSTGALDFLQNKLHKAGFTSLYVYDNSPTVDPGDLINGTAMIYCGDTLAQCGEPNALCAFFKGETVVNGDIYSYKIDYTVLCDETLAQCGEATALAGNFSGVTRTLIEYVFPSGAGGYLFYEDFVSSASVIANGGTITGSPTINNGASLNVGHLIGYTQSSSLSELTIISDVNYDPTDDWQYIINQNQHYSFGFDYGESADTRLFVKRGTSTYFYSTAYVSTGRHEWAVTIDTSGNVTFYEDKTQLGNVVTGFTFGTFDSDLEISDMGLPLGGTIYEIALYDHAMTSSQIVANGTTSETLAQWAQCFLVGGPVTRDSGTNEITKIEFVQIPGPQREFLKRLILRYKPMHSWCGLAVNWT